MHAEDGLARACCWKWWTNSQVTSLRLPLSAQKAPPASAAIPASFRGAYIISGLHFFVIALFFAAHRRFIRSDNFFLPAAVSRLPVCAGRSADCGRGLACDCGLVWLRLLWPPPRTCFWISAISSSIRCRSASNPFNASSSNRF